jgi:hypothetical protein
MTVSKNTYTVTAKYFFTDKRSHHENNCYLKNIAYQSAEDRLIFKLVK